MGDFQEVRKFRRLSLRERTLFRGAKDDNSALVRLKRTIALLSAAAASLLILVTLAGFAARWSWRCELLCHFRAQYFWLLLSIAAVLLVARWWRWGAAALAAAAINAAVVTPIYWPASQPAGAGAPLQVVSFNVRGDNDRYDDVIAFLRAQDSDLVLLLEVRPAWAVHLESLADRYPYRHVCVRDDNFGIALYSRRPWRDVETRYIGSSGVPSIVARFESSGGAFTFVGTHPPPPRSQTAAHSRNEQLTEISAFLAEADGPQILAGDLNITAYSPYFNDLLRTANLRDTRQGIGIQPTWFPPALPPLAIAIDHCLVSDDFAVLDRRTGPPLGSDHRPVMVHIALPN